MKAITETFAFTTKTRHKSIGFFHILLILLAFISALGVLYTKDLNRRLFIKYQKTELFYAAKLEEQQNLILEQSTWSTHNRIQVLAQKKLGMMVPAYDKTIIINKRSSEFAAAKKISKINKG